MTKYTDIHILTSAGKHGLTLNTTGSLLFPGALNANMEHESFLNRLLSGCLPHRNPDFVLNDGGVIYRVRRDSLAVDGTWYRLRRMAEHPPNLNALPAPLPPQMVTSLCNPELSRGGLIYIVGGPGCGKTTTASAIVVSRLTKLGGVAYTIEDPPEMPLNGRHGLGYCTQTSVAGENSADWVESMRGVLRSQPVGTSLMMYVGEVRDAEAARTMMRAASNGFLVICTGFGSDIPTAIDALLQLLGEDYATTLAYVLRIVLWQNIRNGRFGADMLVSENSSSRVAVSIRNKVLSQLSDEIASQRNAMIQNHKVLNT